MPKFKDWTGEKVGDLTVIGLGKKYKNGKITWDCRCKCGRVVRRISFDLSHKRATHCSKCANRVSQIVHGMTGTKIYQVWQGIKARCYNPNNNSYKNYGGRGIRLCDDWKSDFQVFYDWAVSNGYKEGLSIERLDVNGNYCPDNCSWIPMSDQAKNTRANVFIEHGGERETLSEWNRVYGLPLNTVSQRYHERKIRGEPFSFEKLVYNGNLCVKRVNQYTIDGEFIKTWNSIAEAGRSGYDRTGISMCCHGKRNSASGYVWRLAES